MDDTNYTVVIQRHNGKNPSELIIEAERQRDRAWQKLAQIARMDDDTPSFHAALFLQTEGQEGLLK